MLLLNSGGGESDTEKNSKNGTSTFLRNNCSIMHCTVYPIEFQFHKTKSLRERPKDTKLLSCLSLESVIHLISFSFYPFGRNILLFEITKRQLKNGYISICTWCGLTARP